jgi:hypothetical protein
MSADAVARQMILDVAADLNRFAGGAQLDPELDPRPMAGVLASRLVAAVARLDESVRFRLWTSPNGVEHAVASTGWCATCGRYDHPAGATT